jgi:hypothetical protein
MEIIRNPDGTLIVPVAPARVHDDADAPAGDTPTSDAADSGSASPDTQVLHPGEGGYDEALAAWDLQQNPDREAAVSTPSGREEAMAIIDAVATAPDHAVAPAVQSVDDPEASAEALRHVLVGGVHSVEDFAAEVSEATGHEPLPAHKVTKIIGEVLAEIDG